MSEMPAGDEGREGEAKPKRRVKGSARVRAGPSISGVKTKRKPGWPFLYYEENGVLYYNPAPRVTKQKQQATDFEPALF